MKNIQENKQYIESMKVSSKKVNSCNTHESNLIGEYQISLFFAKRGSILLLRDTDGRLTLPVSMASWSQSPEECACDIARRTLSMRIDQFDYPLGFQHIKANSNIVTSYALLPSMWKESKSRRRVEWLYPLDAISQMTEQSKDIVRRYYSRVENQITFGSYCS